MRKIVVDLSDIGFKKDTEIECQFKKVRAAGAFIRDFKATQAKANDLEIQARHVGDDDDKAFDLGLDIITGSLDMAEEAFDFIVKVLELKKREQSKLEDCSTDEIISSASAIAMGLVGISPNAKPVDADKKSD